MHRIASLILPLANFNLLWLNAIQKLLSTATNKPKKIPRYLTLFQHVKTYVLLRDWKLVEQLTARALRLPKNQYTAVVAETLPVFGEDQLDHS